MITTKIPIVDGVDFFSTSDDEFLLANSETGGWVGNLSWAIRAKDIQPQLAEARVRLRSNPRHAQALRITAEWFALNGWSDSAIIFFERAEAGGDRPDMFLLACSYLDAASRSEPYPYLASSTEDYKDMIRDWHIRRVRLASKARSLFIEALKSPALGASQRQAATVYAAISRSILADKSPSFGDSGFR